MTTAFVLSGGASLGAIQAGMLRALFERNIVPDLLVGTSAGALNAAYLASRPPTVATADALAEVWRRTRSWEVFPPDPVTATLGLVGVKDHLVPAAGVRAVLRRQLKLDHLEQATTPLHIIATDVLTGRERRLSSGSARDAVLASSAIPGVFPSVKWEDGRRLVDGGVANNTPISDAVELGADTIYVLPTGIPCELTKPPKGAVGMIVHALTLLVGERLLLDLERLAEQAKIILLPPPCPLDVLGVDFSHADELVRRGHEEASAALDHPHPEELTPMHARRLRPHADHPMPTGRRPNRRSPA